MTAKNNIQFISCYYDIEELTEDEIDTLIKDAKAVSKDEKFANNGKGIMNREE